MLPEDKFKGRYNPNSNRLKYHDYQTEGGYFITICTKQREKYFGEIIEGKMNVSELGEIATQCYLEIPKHFPHVTLDEFAIMPNHIHGIIFINHPPTVETKNLSSLNLSSQKYSPQNLSSLNSPQIPPNGTSKTIGSIVRGFKIGVTKYAREKGEIFQVWQANYYDHVIRNNDELEKIRQYIQENPLNWESDEENTKNEV